LIIRQEQKGRFAAEALKVKGREGRCNVYLVKVPTDINSWQNNEISLAQTEGWLDTKELESLFQ